MANIIEQFKVQLLLSNGEGQSFDRFFESFENATKYRPAERAFILEYDNLEWEVCTHSNHLFCRTTFYTRESAEEAEQSAFEILSSYDYFDNEED